MNDKLAKRLSQRKDLRKRLSLKFVISEEKVSEIIDKIKDAYHVDEYDAIFQANRIIELAIKTAMEPMTILNDILIQEEREGKEDGNRS